VIRLSETIKQLSACKSDTLVAQVLDHAPVALFAVDRNDMVLFSVGRAAAVMSLEVGLVYHRGRGPLGSTVPDGALEIGSSSSTPLSQAPIELIEALDQALAGEHATVLIRRNGLVVSVSIEPVVAGGRVIGAEGVGVDITTYHLALEAVRDREERMRQIVQAVPDGILLINEHGCLEGFNPAASVMFGYAAGEVIGRHVAMLVPEAVGCASPAALARCFALDPMAAGSSLSPSVDLDDSAAVGREAVGRHRNGSRFPIEIRINELRRERWLGFIGIVRDISQRKAIEQALQTSQERYALAARGSNDGLWDWDIPGNSVYYSARWREMTGFEASAHVGRLDDWLNRIHPDDREWVSAALAGGIERAGSPFQIEYRLLRDGGTYRWMLARGIALGDSGGQPVRVAGSQTDINELKLAFEQLQFDALHDRLTGLGNRLTLLQKIDQSLRLAERHPELRFAVIFADVERFSQVNEALGYEIGDRLLNLIGQRLCHIAQEDASVARTGGDDFGVLLDRLTSSDQALSFASRVVEAFSIPFEIAGRDVFLAISVGVAISSDNYHKAEEMLRAAELAMRKGKGRIGIEVADDDSRQRAVRRFDIEDGLRRAVARGELDLHYQPIVQLADGRLAGFEALARWQRPDHGMVPPAEFIPVAETTGLIVPIGREVLERAALQLAAWQSRGHRDLFVCVNVSGRQFAERGFIDDVKAILDRCQVDPRRIKLEITESQIIECPELAAETLRRLKALGLTVAIDDFGTGYSSLSYLYKFAFDTLKIDGSFAARMDRDEDCRAIVNAIGALARSLKVTVVAEGIESLAIVPFLLAADITFGQGYAYSRPMPAAACTPWMERSVGGLGG